MYARLTTVVFAATEADAARSIFDHVRPTMEELDGFGGMMVLSGMDERSLVVLTLWRTAQALDAAEPILEAVKKAETAFRQVERKETARFYVAGSRLGV
jgi:heme-degrading monooxygenase HmoA